MQENNYEYLAKQLKYTGFGEEIALQLRGQMLNANAQFTLQHQAVYGRDQATATLHFRKSENADMYFFNSYRLEVEKGNQSEVMGQTFYINKNEENITLKEGYNLLQGRAVHKELATKEGEKYYAWVQLDFKNIDENSNFIVKKFHQNYGFDLVAELNKHALKELLNDEDKKLLVQSLERGNRQVVVYMQGDTEKKFYLEAAPQFKSLNIYDENMKRVLPKLSAEKERETQQQTQKAAVHKRISADGNEDATTTKTQSKGKRNSLS